MEIEKYINTNITEKCDKKTLLNKISNLFGGRVEVTSYENDNYTECTNYYTLNLKPEIHNPNALELTCHGLVFNLENKLVCWNLPLMMKMDDKITGEINENVIKTIPLWKELYDGTAIKMFYDGKWILSTNRQIDANIAKYNSEITFAELFKKYLGGNSDLTPEEKYKNLCEMLNKNYNYIFVIHSKETCKYLKNKIKPKIIHTETYDIKNNKNVPFTTDEIEKTNGETGKILLKNEGIYKYVTRPGLYVVKSSEEIKKIYNDDEIYGLVGLMLIGDIICGYKLINDKVWKKIEYMSNNPNINYNIINNICQGRGEEFSVLYPEYKNDVTELNNKISKSAKKIYDIYIKCFVLCRNIAHYKKEIGQWCKPVIFKLHDFYNNGGGKITYDITREIMLSLGAPVVASIVGIDF
jgi:hypothetical protein